MPVSHRPWLSPRAKRAEWAMVRCEARYRALVRALAGDVPVYAPEPAATE